MNKKNHQKTDWTAEQLHLAQRLDKALRAHGGERPDDEALGNVKRALRNALFLREACTGSLSWNRWINVIRKALGDPFDWAGSEVQWILVRIYTHIVNHPEAHLSPMIHSVDRSKGSARHPLGRSQTEAGGEMDGDHEHIALMRKCAMELTSGSLRLLTALDETFQS
ncbi:MAG: hypothetical protein JJU29_16855 [Verrucomicrobia bacterium]|nr:hypothetical protein [Verrucomicrobiota bacterium]MCH8513523.1 hypothetical protein [Kiritimatiellia bacterium]